MLKLLLLTLGAWSGVSLLLVGTLGFLLHLRQQGARAAAIARRAGSSLCDGRVSATSLKLAIASSTAKPVRARRPANPPRCSREANSR